MHNKRITKSEDFKRVFRKGIRVGGLNLVTHAVLSSPEEKSRVGFVVSRKVGNAVTRNLVRRRLSGIVREIKGELGTGIDFVFRANPASSTAKYLQLKEDVLRQVAKARTRLKP